MKMKIIALFVFLLATSHCQVKGSYIIRMTTEGYSNPSNIGYGAREEFDDRPGCCDSHESSTCTGSRRCDNFFHYCLFSSGRSPSTRLLSTPCPGGMKSLSSTDDAVIDFSTSTVLGLDNPLTLAGLTSSWSGIQLYIEVGDDDSSSDDLIDQFVIELSSATYPIGSIINRATYNGIRGYSQIDLTIEIACDGDFVGANCDIPASSIDCGQNGQVAMDATCMCDQGYTGSMCETNVDDCLLANMPCNNNGLCIDGINSYICNCNTGYTGLGCNVNIPDCMGVNCNNGVCVDGINSFTCDCNSGYTGQFCDINIDDCFGLNCNNGMCVDGINSFTCDCNSGYTADSFVT